MDRMEFRMESWMDRMESRMKKMEETLGNFQATFSKYVNNQSWIQESSDLECMYSKFIKWLPTVECTKANIREVYLPTGNILTDIDGCIILNTEMKKPEHNPNMRNNSKEKQPFYHFKKGILLESKHALNKQKIDSKLTNIVDFMRLLSSLQGGTLDGTEKFSEFVEEFDLMNFPQDLYLVFSSGDISFEIRSFLLDIQSGKIEQTYDTYVTAIFRTHPIQKVLKKDSRVLNVVKRKLKAIKDVEELRTLIQTEPTLSSYQQHLLPILIPYSDMKDVYRRMKGKLGILQFMELTLPGIFPQEV